MSCDLLLYAACNLEDKPIWLGHGSELSPSLNKGSLKEPYPVKSQFNQKRLHFVLYLGKVQFKLTTKIGNVLPKIEGL